MSRADAVARAQHELELEERQEEPRRWSDLARLDYDAPKERLALVSWCGEVVDHFREVRPAHWRVVMAGDASRWSYLHDWGVLCFGPPPWRRSQVLRVVGRLGSVEAAVKALAAPSIDFAYSFAFDEASMRPVEPAVVSRRRGGALAKPKVSEDERMRARWRRVARQGELF